MGKIIRLRTNGRRYRNTSRDYKIRKVRREGYLKRVYLNRASSDAKEIRPHELHPDYAVILWGRRQQMSAEALLLNV